MLVVHRHRVRHLPKVIWINNWKCLQRHPNRRARVYANPDVLQNAESANKGWLPAPVAHFAGINCTKLIRGSIGCWLFRQALLALRVWLRVEVSAYHAQCCPRLNGFDSADNATPLAGAVPYPDGVFECVSRLNHHSRSVRASLIASRSSKTCQISSESSSHFA
jgi:hypothetical protein